MPKNKRDLARSGRGKRKQTPEGIEFKFSARQSKLESELYDLEDRLLRILPARIFLTHTNTGLRIETLILKFFNKIQKRITAEILAGKHEKLRILKRNQSKKKVIQNAIQSNGTNAAQKDNRIRSAQNWENQISRRVE